jgi:tetratricopeptide (TPR) repeat protein
MAASREVIIKKSRHLIRNMINNSPVYKQGEIGLVLLSSNIHSINKKADMDIMQIKANKHFFFTCIVTTLIFICGCSHFQVKSNVKEANDLLSQGSFKASLNKYEQIIEKYPHAGDRILYEMGFIYAHPKNDQKDYQKSLECFQKIIKEYPESRYRQDSKMMILYLNNINVKDKKIAEQNKQIVEQQTMVEALEREIKNRDDQILALQKKIEVFEQEMESKILLFQSGPADKILIEKKERRLRLFAEKKVLKTYKIALGGNPEGPKERQGDNKTPEGIYHIDSRNKNSRYHLSLHISYPNEKDKKRARELGVSPGGDIMIHGIKNKMSWVGEDHADIDWTKGCIAVTDEEIEEIEKLVPNGTLVEIRP